MRTTCPAAVQSTQSREKYPHRLANRLLQWQVHEALGHSHDRHDSTGNPQRNGPRAKRVVTAKLHLPPLVLLRAPQEYRFPDIKCFPHRTVALVQGQRMDPSELLFHRAVRRFRDRRVIEI